MEVNKAEIDTKKLPNSSNQQHLHLIHVKLAIIVGTRGATAALALKPTTMHLFLLGSSSRSTPPQQRRHHHMRHPATKSRCEVAATTMTPSGATVATA